MAKTQIWLGAPTSSVLHILLETGLPRVDTLIKPQDKGAYQKLDKEASLPSTGESLK